MCLVFSVWRSIKLVYRYIFKTKYKILNTKHPISSTFCEFTKLIANINPPNIVEGKIMIESIFQETKENMGKSIVALRNELNKIRTGRASLSILDDIIAGAKGRDARCVVNSIRRKE